jgi:hypothetical protein
MSLPLMFTYCKEILMLQGLPYFTDLLFVCLFKKKKGKAVPLHAMWAHEGQQRYSSIHS